ncbi:reducing polyketide synthase FUB1-like [Acanthaster planci]|uniref:Fatty acid synthase n=1 Tax=Acanthaster planci TaxID=133434 RepID=A0A8B7XZ13_ACAPL|nr:reducing polyketide synthase FUB1-like [Acanthaster planci]
MPGDVRSPEDFWAVIRDGKDTITEVPPHRWSLENFYDPDHSKKGKMISRKGGFIDGIDKFDNSFFRISPREAASMDPQQRILLEVVHEAFEDAGIISETLGASGGVYVGVGMMDYAVQTVSETSLINPYTLTGTSFSTAANRVSYAFDLRGPSYSVDTACASSVTAMHLACTGLWNHECKTAVVAGCNALIIPETSVAFTALGALSKDSKCCPFSSTAKGYVRSEGWGAVILKPLPIAQKDGDHIYALIRGTAIAANGFSTSLTMPSSAAQEYVMKQAYFRFGVPLSNVQYVEAHGTGTPVGDPIEAEAIGKAFGPHREKPLKIGSAKGNFGHNECASGVTTLIKVALMLDHKVLCPTINFTETNPNIKLDEWKLQIQTELQELPSSEKTLTFGLNSAGFGGAVGHIILQEAPRGIIQAPAAVSAGWRFGGGTSGSPIVVPLSAISTEALHDVAEQWRGFRSEHDALRIVSWLTCRRKHYECRLAVISNSGEAFQEQLEQYLEVRSGSEISAGVSREKPKICFVFPGQGQQWGKMGQRLFLRETVFREAILECDEVFKNLSGWSLLYDKNIFTNGSKDQEDQTANLDSEMKETAVLQPSILFFQIGLLHLLRYWGILPDVIVGHSLGEVAAAYACGGLTLQEAVHVIYHRSFQQAQLKGAGSMAALRLPLAEAKDVCQQYDNLYVAAVNAPAATTIAGDTDAISEIARKKPTVAKQLRVQCAFHTPFMDSMEAPFRLAMKGSVNTEPGAGSIPFYSTVIGEVYTGAFGTNYWWQNIRGTVKFQAAVEEVLNNKDVNVFLEIGASATLLSSVNQIYARFKGRTSPKLIPTGQREQDDYLTALRALSNLYVAGCDINWRNVTGGPTTWAQLPTYPWQHQSFWLETDERRKRRLGQDDRTFKGQAGNISLEMFPFLADHVVQDQLVFPGAGYVEMMVQSVFDEDECPALSKVSFSKIIAWTESEDGNTKPLGLQCHREGSHVEVTLDGSSYSSAKINISSEPELSLISIEEILLRCTTRVSGEDIYHALADLGLDYGPSFQVIKEAALGDGEVLGFLSPVKSDSKQRMQVTHLDACFQLLLVASGSNTSLYLPVFIQSLHMSVPRLSATESLVAYVRMTEFDSRVLAGDITISTCQGRVLLKAYNCECRNITGSKTGVPLESCLYITRMQPLQSCFPNPSTACEKFELDYLRKNFPDETEFLTRAQPWIPSLERVCISCIYQALNGTAANKHVDQRLGRYLKQTTETSRTNCPSEVAVTNIASVLDNIEANLPEIQPEIALLRSLANIAKSVNITISSNRRSSITRRSSLRETSPGVIDSALSRLCYRASADAIHSAVKEAIHKKNVVRILEVGGQHGGLATYALPLLNEFCDEMRLEYICSYLAFHSGAYPHHDQPLSFPFVKYKQLDLQQDVVSQGFVPGSVDVIICMEKIQLSGEYDSSLRNMHKLLCDGGWLFMCEMTSDSCIGSVLFDRQEGYFLTEGEWRNTLSASGFQDIVVASPPQECFHSIFVSRKVKDNRITFITHPASCPIFLILTDHDTTDVSTFPNVVCGKLGVPADKVVLKGNDLNSALSQNSRTQRNSLVCLYNSQHGLYELTKLLQQVDSKTLMFRNVFVVITGTKTRAAEVVGLVRSVTNEIHVPVYSVYMGDTEDASIESLAGFLNDKEVRDREIEISEGEIRVPRILRAELSADNDVVNECHWQVAINKDDTSQGGTSSFEDLGFQFLDDLDPLPGQVVVHVKSAALNFKDVMLSLGLLDGLDDNDDTIHIGLECSGKIQKIGDGVNSFRVGDEVMGFGKHCFASQTICDEKLLVHKPSSIGWNEAAGVCVVFTTAYHSLIQRAHLQKGETVLIHSACGGVGLAAIQIASMIGAHIICTAGSEEKRSYLRNNLGIELVTDSHSERFYDDVMVWTKGAGVDVVLNSLHGEKLSRGIEALAPGGRFCEIGKRDILQNSNLQMSLLLENKSFLSCQIDRMIKLQKAKMHELLLEVTSLFREDSVLASIPTTVYPIGDYQGTFARMAKGNHIGKMVFNIPADFKPPRILSCSRIFDNNATYIITGGYGGLGLALAKWICDRGACYLALVSRRGCKTDAAHRTVRFLERKGTTVFGFALDVSKASDVQSMLSDLATVHGAPVVKGVFHVAGHIVEESLSTLTPEVLNKILGAKATGAKNLHDLTRHLPLEVFFLMSSSSAMWGHSSQPGYCAANAYLDALAEERRDQGLPAVSLQLGPVRGVGFLEKMKVTIETLAIKGCLTLHIDEILHVIGQILQTKDAPAVLSLSNQEWNSTLKFCHDGILKFQHLLRAVRPRRSVCASSTQRKVLEDRMRKKMAHLLCINPDSIDLEQSMVTYGMDSLMAVEMVAWASKEFNTSITQVEILGGLTTGALLQRLLLSQTV